MFKMIRQLFSLLDKNQVRQFCILQILVVIMAFAEVLGIASIAPFMALVGDISILEREGMLSNLYQMTGAKNPMDFLFYIGLTVLLTLTLSSLISMFTVWKLSTYAASIGTEISDRLYTHYMQQNWLFHIDTSSAHLTKQVSTEALRVTDQIIQPLMQMNAKVVLAIFISVGIFIYNPLVAISGLVLFVSIYIILYSVVQKRLHRNGSYMSSALSIRFRLMSEGFGGIRDVLLLNRRHDFVERFQSSGKVFANAYGANASIGQVPRYFMELLAFGAMIILILFLIKAHQGNLGEVLAVLAVYALAAFKILPALQQIYSSITQIKGSIASFEAIEQDLIQSSDLEIIEDESLLNHYLSFDHEIKLENITFTYPNKSSPAVDGLNMIIPVNSVIGIVGASGSGKSTTVDILLGLLTPQEGNIRIDNTFMDADNKRAWQNTLGYVPQSIFLSEGTIAENVAFGLPTRDINLDQVNEALGLANLIELVEQLPDGVNTYVGERGVQLSGGQRQRIGIARALYYQANVLVFDEATSALDGITEKIIMEAIHKFSGQKTIVMIAHRLKTVQKCNTIYMMDEGKIVDYGTYNELLEKNSKFKEMAEHS